MSRPLRKHSGIPRSPHIDGIEDRMLNMRLPYSPEPHPGLGRSLYLQGELKSQSSLVALRSLTPNRDSTISLSGRCYYIGIDFGTTYSGIAWASSADLDNIQIVRRWGTRDSNFAHIHDDSKVPTSLLYSRDSKLSINWGYEAPDSENPIKWFKLLLLKDEDIPEDIMSSAYLQEARARLDEEGITPLEAVSDFLKMLWGHAMQSIKKAKGASTVEGIPFKVVLTVPAIWPPYAQARMKEAAARAGILVPRLAGPTTLQLVAEPEAAALAALRERDKHEIKKGDVYVVCDAGGGTTDIISYKVKQVNPLVLTEIVEGQGKLCGAMFVDEAFHNTLKTRLGSGWDKLNSERKAKLMNDEWEFGIKRIFNGEPDRTWKVQVNDDQIKLGTGNLKTIFGKVIHDIRGLVNDQIKSVEKKEGKSPKAVILVGGFGCSTYLYQRLFAELDSRNIEVLQSDGKLPWTAICRGAVIRAASNIVQSRISRFSYGIKANYPFEEGQHRREDREWNEYYCRWEAKDQMRWYVEKGQDIDVLEPLKFNFVVPHTEPLYRNTYSVQILQCDQSPPPTTATAAVKVLCNIHCQLGMNWEDLPEYTNKDGLMFKEFQYDLEMVREDASLEFITYFNGGRQSSEQVQVELDPSRPTTAALSPRKPQHQLKSFHGLR